MEIFIVAFLVIAGIGLIVAEVILVPGTTFVGIFGFVATFLGVYFAYSYFGNNVGMWVMIVSAVLALGILIYGLRSNAWDSFSLKQSIQGKVNEGDDIKVNKGDMGKALSTLKPFGKVEFGDEVMEVRTMGNYIDSGEQVKIVKIEGRTIWVEPA